MSVVLLMIVTTVDRFSPRYSVRSAFKCSRLREGRRSIRSAEKDVTESTHSIDVLIENVLIMPQIVDELNRCTPAGTSLSASLDQLLMLHRYGCSVELTRFAPTGTSARTAVQVASDIERLLIAYTRSADVTTNNMSHAHETKQSILYLPAHSNHARTLIHCQRMSVALQLRHKIHVLI